MQRQGWEFLFDPLQEIEANFLEALISTKLFSEATHFRIKVFHGLEGFEFERQDPLDRDDRDQDLITGKASFVGMTFLM